MLHGHDFIHTCIHIQRYTHKHSIHINIDSHWRGNYMKTLIMVFSWLWDVQILWFSHSFKFLYTIQVLGFKIRRKWAWQKLPLSIQINKKSWEKISFKNLKTKTKIQNDYSYCIGGISLFQRSPKNFMWNMQYV